MSTVILATLAVAGTSVVATIVTPADAIVPAPLPAPPLPAASVTPVPVLASPSISATVAVPPGELRSWNSVFITFGDNINSKLTPC